MSQFFFDFPEQVKALYECGYSYEEATAMVQEVPLSGESCAKIMSSISDYYGPFSGNAVISIIPYDERYSMFCTKNDVKDGELYRNAPFKDDTNAIAITNPNDVDLPF